MTVIRSIAPIDARDRPVVRSWCTGILLGGLLFVPGGFGFFFEELSFATGTALMCALGLLLAGLGSIPLDARNVQAAFGVMAASVLVIVAHLLIADAVSNDANFVVGRAMFSLILFGLIALAVPTICDAIMTSDGRIAVLVQIMCLLFAVSAIFSLLGVQPATPNLGEKPTFPYTEPSFLGFSLTGVLIFTALRSTRIVRAVIIIAFLALGYGLSNFTIIVTCMVAAVVVLPLWWIAAGAAALIVGEVSLDLTYYLDRLNFDWATSNNLSSLVYAQGWQMLEESLRKTNGWGLGFQQLGMVYTNVPASFRINSLLGRDANLQDGGFILSKAGSEFGILGLTLIACYLYLAFRSLLKLRMISQRKSPMRDTELFARACIVGYIVELVVRGSSYFTGTFVLLLVSLLHLYRMRRINTNSGLTAPGATG